MTLAAFSRTLAARFDEPIMHPYENLPPDAFWRSAVAEREPLEISGLWEPKFQVKASHRVATAGSCFAQHIGRALKERGYGWVDAEPAPKGLSPEGQKRFNYGVFSCRTGNIYTAALLRQWVSWALGASEPPDEFFENDGRIVDPFRPNIEPNGFASVEEMRASRRTTLAALREIVETCDVFVFTLGLTEAWVNAQTGLVYPMCPGTVAGTFVEGTHVFRNYGYGAVLKHLNQAIDQMREANPKLRVLLTVSPVPLTATASGKHVLTATTHSKSVLRAVAGELAGKPGVDYFPSYEIISSFPFRGMFYEDNLRGVKPEGVAFVMKSFFASFDAGAAGAPVGKKKKGRKRQQAQARAVRADAVVCEEELLEAFS